MLHIFEIVLFDMVEFALCLSVDLVVVSSLTCSSFNIVLSCLDWVFDNHLS